MGWTGLHRDKGMTTKAFFEMELPVTLTQHGKILESAVVGNVFYAAVENTNEAAYAPGETWALVILMQWGRGYFNFHYKDMDETVAGDYSCPAKILDLLSPTDHEAALAWRAQCRITLERKARARKVTKGTTVKFPRPFTFTDGYEGDEFEFVQRNTFRVPGLGRYSISNWREMDFEVVPAA